MPSDRLSLLLSALVSVAVMGCSGFVSSHDVPEQPRPRVPCQTEWRGDRELAGGEEIKTACARACRGHARKDFAAAGASCQTVFRLIHGRSNFGT